MQEAGMTPQDPDRAGVGEPVGSLMTVPASSTSAGSRPFIAAIWSTGTPAVAARLDSVSP